MWWMWWLGFQIKLKRYLRWIRLRYMKWFRYMRRIRWLRCMGWRRSLVDGDNSDKIDEWYDRNYLGNWVELEDWHDWNGLYDWDD